MSAVLAEELAVSRQRQWDSLRDLAASCARRRPVRRVGVVGNKPLQPDARRAATIDPCDLVFRANALALDEPDDEPTLGTRCEVVILSYATPINRWVFRDYRRRVYLVPQLSWTLYKTMSYVPEFWPADLGCMPIPNDPIKIRLVELMRQEHDPGWPAGHLTPTSGTTAMFLAHEWFPDADVVVTGFSFLNGRPQAEWAHHSGGGTKIFHRHNLEAEGALLRHWIDAGRTQYFE